MSKRPAWRNTPISWGVVARFFHWTVALLILVQMTLGLYMVSLPLSLAKLRLFLLHKSLSLVVFGLVLLRLAWRVWDAHPAPPRGTTARQYRRGWCTSRFVCS